MLGELVTHSFWECLGMFQKRLAFELVDRVKICLRQHRWASPSPDGLNRTFWFFADQGRMCARCLSWDVLRSLVFKLRPRSTPLAHLVLSLQAWTRTTPLTPPGLQLADGRWWDSQPHNHVSQPLLRPLSLSILMVLFFCRILTNTEAYQPIPNLKS